MFDKIRFFLKKHGNHNFFVYVIFKFFPDAPERHKKNKLYCNFLLDMSKTEAQKDFFSKTLRKNNIK